MQLMKSIALNTLAMIAIAFSFNLHASTTWVPISVGDITVIIPYVPESVVYEDAQGNLYVKLTTSHGHKLLKLTDGLYWTSSELTQDEWNQLSLTQTNYSISYGDFLGDSSQDLKISNNGIEIIVENSNGSYVVYSSTNGPDGEIKEQAPLSSISDETRFAKYSSISQNVIGELAGNSSVDGGAFSYSVPLNIAPGRKGIQPKIALNYNSQSGKGIAGYGWSLSASQSISRCSEIYDLDESVSSPTMSSNDKLCFNGSRLLITSDSPSAYGVTGAIYATERNPSVYIEQSGNINGALTSFTVYHPDGSKAFFGASTNSKVIYLGHTSSMQWLLASQEDVSGNQVHYTYLEGVGSRYLQHIYYTGENDNYGTRKVSFNYTDEPVKVSYQWGGKAEHNRKLSSIDMSIHDTIRANWSLTYASSNANQLDSLSYCNAQDSSECISTTFGWYEKVLSHSDPLASTSFDDNIADLADEDKNFFYGDKVKKEADFDGDGVLDLSTMRMVQLSRDKSVITLSDLPDQTIFNTDPNFSSDEYFYANYYKNSSNFINGTMDYNLDGKADLVYINDQNEIVITQVEDATKNTATWNTGIDGTCYGAVTQWRDVNCQSMIVDFNGDGRSDILVATNLSTNTSSHLNITYKAYQRKATGLGFEEKGSFITSIYASLQPIDVDGDGYVDMAPSSFDQTFTWYKSVYNPVDNSLSFIEKTTTINASYDEYKRDKPNKWVDFNSDGLVDILTLELADTLDNKYTWAVAFNKGNNQFSAPELTNQYELAYGGKFGVADARGSDAESARVYNQFAHYLDYNGDGHLDILVPDYSRKKYLYQCWNWNSNEDCLAIDRGDAAKFHDYDVWYWNVLLGQEDGLTFVEQELSVYGALATMNPLDYNGDGYTDFVSSAGYESPAARRTWFYSTKSGTLPADYERNFLVFQNANSNENVLKSATTGRGEKFVVNYKILNDANVRSADFSKQADACDTADPHQGCYPYLNFSNTMKVVSELNTDNGIGGKNTTEYRYGNARFHAAGRGFQGFGSIEVEDVSANIETVTTFEQNFPWSGMVSSRTVTDTSSSVLLSRYEVTELFPLENAYSAGSSYCYFAGQSTNTRYSPIGAGGYITAQGEMATVASTLVKNHRCQVTSNTVTTTDSTNIHQKVVTQNYKDEGEGSFISLPNVTNTAQTVTYKTSSALVSSSPTQYEFTTTKTVNYSDLLPANVLVTSATSNALIADTSNTTVYAYGDYGNVKRITSSGGGESRWQGRVMSSDGYVVDKTTNSEWGDSVFASTNEYDALTGQLTESIDVLGNKVTSEINFLGAVLSVSSSASNGSALAPTAYTVYDWSSVTSIQDGSPTVVVDIDSLGRQIKQTTQGFDGSLIVSETAFDRIGRVLSLTTPTASYGTQLSTTYGAYDALGRPSSKTVDNGSVSYTSTYDYQGFTTQIEVSSDDYVETMYRSYNASKQLLRTTDAIGGKTYFVYNAANQPIVIKDVKQNEITARYDGLGQKAYFNDPNMGKWQFTYNGFSEVSTQTDARDINTGFIYDDLGRLVAQGGRTWTYDSVGKGLLYQSEFGGKKETYQYDDLKRVSQVTTTIDGTPFIQQYAYDSYYGRMKGEQFASGERVAYRYGQYGYLEEEYQLALDQSETSLRIINAMTALGGIDNQTFGNGIVQHFAYLDSGAVSTICAGASSSCSSSTVQNLGYDYDSMGNLTRQDNYALGFNEEYLYDSLMRVKQADIAVNNVAKGTINYGYDAAGNFTQKTDYANGYLYGNANKNAGGNAGANAVKQITKVVGGTVSFSYDNNGNMTSGDGLAISYNDDNKPTQVTRNGTTSNFSYGADGMRYKQVTSSGATTTTTYYVGSVERQQKVTGTTTTIVDKTYLGGHTVLMTPVQGAFTEPSRIVHTLHDRLGGVDTLLDGSRHIDDVVDTQFLVLQRRGYDLFGRPRDLSASSFGVNSASNLLQDWQEVKRGFTGHEHLPESELIHMNGRVYDYNVGRFLSVDPFLQFPQNSQSANPYSYILNNPMAGTDPTGYLAFIPVAIWAINAYAAYETANAAADAYTSYQNGEISGADVATVVASSALENTLGKKLNVAKEGVQKIRKAFKGDKPDTNVQKSTNASNTDGGSVKNGDDNTQSPNNTKTEASDIGNPESVHTNSTKSQKSTMHYRIEDENGKSYDGVGDADGKRTKQSLKNLEKQNPDKKITVTKQDVHPNRAEAYKAEDKGIQSSGGPQGKDPDGANYNKINSPGKKLNDEEWKQK
jgi:RHS repeat-associated protein